MTKDEFLKIKRTLKASFTAPSFLAPDTLDTWFNMLNRFDIQDIEEGINMYILKESKTPTIRDIVERVEIAKKQRLMKVKAYSKATNTFLCPTCQDRGFLLFWKDEEGHVVDKADGVYEYMKPCRCAAGAAEYPSIYKELYGKA